MDKKEQYVSAAYMHIKSQILHDTTADNFSNYTYTHPWESLYPSPHDIKLINSVVKSRRLCYFQESRSTCQKFHFLESRSNVKIFYFLESRK